MEALLPTTKHRRGRRTARQQRALADPGPWLLAVDELTGDEWVGGTRPLVMDIGFGSGEAVVAIAAAEPEVGILAVDMHTPGIGDLLASVAELDLVNIRVLDADVRHVIDLLPAGRLAGVRTYFPDPWPKKRHHRRRLITPAFARGLAARVSEGGFWHVATDWQDYAEAIQEAVTSTGRWSGGPIDRPSWRPETRYERRGRAAGRDVLDLWFTRVTS